MEPLYWSAFVLQRRINAPLVDVERVLCDQRRVDDGTVVPIDDAMRTQFDTRFELVFPHFGFEATSWRAFATVRSKRRRAEALEIEVNAWDRRSTELVVRPRSSRVKYWSGRRAKRYFHCAHAAADAIGAVVQPAVERQRELVSTSR